MASMATHNRKLQAQLLMVCWRIPPGKTGATYPKFKVKTGLGNTVQSSPTLVVGWLAHIIHQR